MRRRTLLASVGAAAAGLAGCLARGEDPPGTDEPGNSPEPTDTPTEEPTPTPAEPPEPRVVDSTVETLGTGCASDQHGSVDVAFESAGAAVDGVAIAPDPCHEATVESAAVEAGELRLRVGLASSDGACVDCVGAVAYAATVDLENADSLEAVTVVHADSGESFTVERGGEEPSPSPDGEPVETQAEKPRPDPDLAITVANEHDESHEVGVEVRREGGAFVHESNQGVEPGEQREVYNLKQASPDGIEPFEVTATLDGEEETVTVETSTCDGDVVIEVTGDGELYVYHSMC